MAASFAALLDEQIEKVNTFYTERVEEGVMLLSALNDHCATIVRATPRTRLMS